VCRDNKILDFHWNPSDPWTIASVSQGSNRADGKRVETGGTLQVISTNISNPFRSPYPYR